MTDFGCVGSQPWNSRKGSRLEMKAGKPLGGKVYSDQEWMSLSRKREGTSTGLQGQLGRRDDERGKPIKETAEELRRERDM